MESLEVSMSHRVYFGWRGKNLNDKEVQGLALCDKPPKVGKRTLSCLRTGPVRGVPPPLAQGWWGKLIPSSLH